MWESERRTIHQLSRLLCRCSWDLNWGILIHTYTPRKPNYSPRYLRRKRRRRAKHLQQFANWNCYLCFFFGKTRKMIVQQFAKALDKFHSRANLRASCKLPSRRCLFPSFARDPGKDSRLSLARPSTWIRTLPRSPSKKLYINQPSPNYPLLFAPLEAQTWTFHTVQYWCRDQHDVESRTCCCTFQLFMPMFSCPWN
jgi:hypothetical protein